MQANPTSENLVSKRSSLFFVLLPAIKLGLEVERLSRGHMHPVFRSACAIGSAEVYRNQKTRAHGDVAISHPLIDGFAFLSHNIFDVVTTFGTGSRILVLYKVVP